MIRMAAILASILVIAGTAGAVPVFVEIAGTVEYNQINQGIFAGVVSGDPVLVSFTVDSEDFINGTYPTRGYVIDHGSFMFTAGPATTGLQDPFPAGLTPYFVVRDNDPAVDGFFLSTGPDWPTGVPTNEPGGLDPYFYSAFEVSYDGATLASLNITEAVGTYDYTGLGSFYFALLDAWAEPMFIEYIDLTISVGSPVEDASWGSIKAMFR
jgi:hypothetical protein